MKHLNKDGVEALDKVATWLENYGGDVGFDMATFKNNGNLIEPVSDYTGNECGTTCCIAGKVYIDNFDRITSEVTVTSEQCHDIYVEEVGCWLGMSEKDIRALFYCDSKGFIGSDINLDEVKPDHAASVIREFIKTGEVKWN